MGDIKGFLKETFDWAEQRSPENRIEVTLNLVSNQKSGLCMYAAGQLVFSPAREVGVKTWPHQFASYAPLKRYTAQAKVSGIAGLPFGFVAPDDINVVISHSGSTINVRIQFLNQGTKAINFEADVVNGLLVGSPTGTAPKPSLSTSPVFLISLTDRMAKPQG